MVAANIIAVCCLRSEESGMIYRVSIMNVIPAAPFLFTYTECPSRIAPPTLVGMVAGAFVFFMYSFLFS